jgi:hypothetical protein
MMSARPVPVRGKMHMHETAAARMNRFMVLPPW